MSDSYYYLFGPVPSRRLGRSLGIDVTPLKTCSFDCVFCQCGCTDRLTAERDEFVPFEDVCEEIDRWLAEDGQADVITFAGSGEPTLYNRLGGLIAHIKGKTVIPVIVLSNGSQLHRIAVRDELQQADIVKVTLSTWDNPSFQKIHRPATGLTFDQLLAGERELRREFAGELWVEVFLMEGLNADPEQVRKISEAVAQVQPDKIHLNTAVRPPAEATVRPVSKEKLHSLCPHFSPQAEVIASFEPEARARMEEVTAEELAALIRRHPATDAQLAAIAGVTEPQIEAALAPLLAAGALRTEIRNDEVYYR
jgi:wyosine [tRNA(Phe)-imidazoG37] synthetase (radical SAM superfamily)